MSERYHLMAEWVGLRELSRRMGVTHATVRDAYKRGSAVGGEFLIDKHNGKYRGIPSDPSVFIEDPELCKKYDIDSCKHCGSIKLRYKEVRETRYHDVVTIVLKSSGELVHLKKEKHRDEEIRREFFCSRCQGDR